MDDATAASLAKASNMGNVLLLSKQSKSQMSTSVGVGKEVARVAQEAVGAQAAQRWAQFAQQFNASRVALSVNIAVDVVGVDNWADPFELIDHLVDATRKRRQLNVVDKQRRGFVDERARVLTT